MMMMSKRTESFIQIPISYLFQLHSIPYSNSLTYFPVTGNLNEVKHLRRCSIVQ